MQHNTYRLKCVLDLVYLQKRVHSTAYPKLKWLLVVGGARE